MSAIILYEDVDFKTLSDRYTNSRMVPFLTHINGVGGNSFFNKSLAKNDPLYGQSTVVVVVVFFFFTVKLDATSNTTEVRPICLKMGHIMRKPVFGIICEHQKRRSA